MSAQESALASTVSSLLRRSSTFAPEAKSSSTTHESRSSISEAADLLARRIVSQGSSPCKLSIRALSDRCDEYKASIAENFSAHLAQPHVNKSSWEDVEFITHINLGPASPAEIERFRNLSWLARDRIPSRHTLECMRLFVSPRLIKEFYDALFYTSIPMDRFNVASNFAIEAQPLLWALRFAAHCVYDWDYCEILGIPTRPSLGAIMLDMIDLTTYLKSLGTTPQKLSSIFKNFVKQKRIRSVDYNNVDADSEEQVACVGYISDLFQIISCCNAGFAETPMWNKLDAWNSHTSEVEDKIPRWTKNIEFPGPDYLVFGKRRWAPIADKSAVDVPLDTIDARYLYSGPFKLTYASKIEEHLTFNDNREIRLYYGGQQGLPIFRLLEHHSLGRAFRAKVVEVEIENLLKLIFTRRLESLNILRKQLRKYPSTLSAYLVNKMIFMKCLHNPTKISKLATFCSSDIVGPCFSEFINPIVYRTEQFPLDRHTLLKVLDHSDATDHQYLVDPERAILGDFDIYQSHLVYLKKQMNEWKPERFFDFFIAAYNDRLAWFTAMVGLMFGILGVIGVMSAILQAIVAAIALRATS